MGFGELLSIKLKYYGFIVAICAGQLSNWEQGLIKHIYWFTVRVGWKDHTTDDDTAFTSA